MSSISLDNVPIEFRGFFNGKYKVEDLVKPSKLAKFFVHCTHAHTGNSKADEFLETVRDGLLALRTSKALSDYHFMKLLYECPILGSSRGKEAVEALKAFETEFGSSYENPQMNKRAAKVARWLHQSLGTLVEENGYPISVVLTSSDGEEGTVDRLQWASALSVYRPLLYGQYKKKEVQASLQTLQFFQSFMDDPEFLGVLNDEEFWDLHREAHAAGFAELVHVSSSHFHRINEENFLEIFVFALRTNNEVLIDACLVFFCQNYSEARFDWSLEKGLKVDVFKFTPKLQLILQGLSLDIQRVRINRGEDLEFMVKNALHLFPQVTSLELTFSLGDYLSQLAQFFPKVTRLGCSYGALNFSSRAPIPPSWRGVEVLEILPGLDEKEIPAAVRYFKTAFPDLKVCIGDHFNDYFREKCRPNQIGEFEIYFGFADHLLFANPAFKERCQYVQLGPIRSLLDATTREIPIETLEYVFDGGLFAYNGSYRQPAGNHNFWHFSVGDGSFQHTDIDKRVTAIIRRCPKIREVRLDGTQVMKESIQRIVQSSIHLESLSLKDCQQIGDQTFAFNWEPNKSMVSLSLDHSQVTYQVIPFLKKLFPLLKTLSLNACPGIDDRALEQIAKFFPNIEHLHLNKTKVTEMGIRELAKNCKQIKTLNAQNTEVTKTVKLHFPESVTIKI